MIKTIIKILLNISAIFLFSISLFGIILGDYVSDIFTHETFITNQELIGKIFATLAIFIMLKLSISFYNTNDIDNKAL